MRVLIINTNRERSPQTLVPLGACCVASAAEEAGHEVSLLDLTFERDPESATGKAVRRVMPDVIGVSIRNLDNCDYGSPRSYLPELKSVVDACRRECGARIVLGGPAVSQAPAQVLTHVGGDLAVVGEGEVAFPALLSAIGVGVDPTGVPGVTTAEGTGQPHTRLPEHVFPGLPDPRPSRWLDLKRYAASDAALPVQTKRGCAFKCSYCSYPLLEGNEWRLREPEWVARQVGEARKLGMRSVEFVDSVFGLPNSHAIACCEEISRTTGGSLPLSTLDLNPLACSPELVEAMNAAGFSAVGISAESGSDDMLASLNKGFDADDLRRTALRLMELRATKMWVFMLGGPGETEATVRETAKFIEQLPRTDLVLVTHGLRVLPGTELQRRLVSEGAVEADADLSRPVFYHSPHISAEQTAQIIAECSFPKENMVSLTDGGHRLAPLAQRLASMLRIRPPYWRCLPTINRARRLLRV